MGVQCWKSTIVGLVQRWYSLKRQEVIAKATQRNNDKKDKKEQGAGGDTLGLAGLELQEAGAPIALEGAVTTCGHSLDDIDIKWTDGACSTGTFLVQRHYLRERCPWFDWVSLGRIARRPEETAHQRSLSGVIR